MQFVVLVDGEIVGQVEINTDAELDRVLAIFPRGILKTPAQLIEEGWR